MQLSLYHEHSVAWHAVGLTQLHGFVHAQAGLLVQWVQSHLVLCQRPMPLHKIHC